MPSNLALGLTCLATLTLAPAQLLAGSRTENKAFKLAPGSHLLVKTANSAITVKGWDKEEIALQADIYDTEARPVKVETRESAKGLEIEAIFTKSEGWSWNMGRGPSCAFTLSVPRRLVADFTTSNAPLTVSEVTGKLTFRTSNGPMKLTNLGGEVEARTSNAPLIAKEVAGDLRGSTSNGPLQIDGVSGGLDFTTSNGPLTALNLDGQGKGIRLRTSNGPMTVGLGKAAGEISAKTSRHESISFHRSAAQDVEIDKGELRAKLPGSTQRIELRTSNGGIEIR